MAAGLDLGVELEAAAVQGDGVLFRELLANLLDNAIPYTPRPRRVTVRTHIDPDRSRVLEVENTGATVTLSAPSSGGGSWPPRDFRPLID